MRKGITQDQINRKREDVRRTREKIARESGIPITLVSPREVYERRKGSDGWAYKSAASGIRAARAHMNRLDGKRPTQRLSRAKDSFSMDSPSGSAAPTVPTLTREQQVKNSVMSCPLSDLPLFLRSVASRIEEYNEEMVAIKEQVEVLAARVKALHRLTEPVLSLNIMVVNGEV